MIDFGPGSAVEGALQLRHNHIRHRLRIARMRGPLLLITFRLLRTSSIEIVRKYTNHRSELPPLERGMGRRGGSFERGSGIYVTEGRR